MYGDQVVAPARAIVRHPANISWEDAAGTWMSFTAAWAGVVDYARIASGDFVVISAASSSVGPSAIQLARRAGAKSIALDAGASHVIVTQNEDVAQAVLKITDQRVARIISDAVGEKAFSSLVAAAAPELWAARFGFGVRSRYALRASMVTSRPILFPFGQNIHAARL